MDRKPPTGIKLNEYERNRLKKYRERSNYFRPKRDKIYVDGEIHYVNSYDALMDSPDSPFGRRYILMNASPHGMLHVNRKKSREYDWAPKVIEIDTTIPSIPKRAMSSMDLRRSETYTSAEDLRYHAVRKAGSCDDILSRERYFSEVAPSESGVSDIDSIFLIDDDVQSQSSICSADRSFSYSEMEEVHDRVDHLDVIEENEVTEDSGNQGSESLSNVTNTTRRLSQGQVSAGALTEELLKLKESQERSRLQKVQDIKEYIENNYPNNRNTSSTSHDSCLGDSIRTDTDYAEFGENGNRDLRSRRELTYSIDSGLDSRHQSTRSCHDSDDSLTTQVETTYISDLPGLYEHEKDKNKHGMEWWSRNDMLKTVATVETTTLNPDKQKDILTFNCYSGDDVVTTNKETIHLHGGRKLHYNDIEADTVNVEHGREFNEIKHTDSEIVHKSINTVDLNDSDRKLHQSCENTENSDNYHQKSEEFFFDSERNGTVIENVNDNNEDITTVTKTIYSTNQSIQSTDDSSISDPQLSNSSSEFQINSQADSDTFSQMSDDNLLTRKHVSNTHENLSRINLNRAEQNNSELFFNQSEVVFPDEMKPADDKDIINSHQYYSVSTIDGKPAHDTKTTVVVYNEPECTSTSLLSTQLNIDQFTTDNHISNDVYILEEKVEESRRYRDHSGRNDVIHRPTTTEITQDTTQISSQEALNHQTIQSQYGDRVKNSGEIFDDVKKSEGNLNLLKNSGIFKDLKESDSHGEQFIDNVKLFEKVGNAVIENWDKDIVKVGVDRKEYFIIKEVMRLESRVSQEDIHKPVDFKLVNDIQEDKLLDQYTITLDLPFTERFIDRCEKFINQSNDRLLIRNNTAGQVFDEVDSSHLSIDYYECIGNNNKEIKSDYSPTKNLESDIMAEKGNINRAADHQIVYDEEEWDNLEDYRPQNYRQTGVKINVLRNKVPNMTRYKMQTISEHDEFDFSQMYNSESEGDSRMTSNVTKMNGIEINMIKTESMNIAQYRVAQQNLDSTDVQYLNTCRTEQAYPNVSLSPQSVASAETTEQNAHLTSAPYYNKFFKSSYHRNINSSQEFHLSTTSETDTYSTSTYHRQTRRNLALGEFGNENMGKSFQFVRDRSDSTEHWLEEQALESKYISTWNRSPEKIDLANISGISDSEVYKTSCFAEVSHVDESGYITYEFQDHNDSFDQSILDVSHDSDGSAYRSTCTAEVNVDIPEDERTENILTSKSSVSLSPTSETSETESGYHTLTRSGKSELSRQDTTEDMTSFNQEEKEHSVYKAQMYGVMNDDEGIKLERVRSQEDITSCLESGQTTRQNYEYHYSLLKEGDHINRANSSEEITELMDAAALQEFIDFSESMGRSFELEEQKLLSEMESSEEASFTSGNMISSTENIDSITNEQNKVRKTVIEIFDSSEDLTGCIELEVDDDGTIDSKRTNQLDISKARSTEDLVRNLDADSTVSLRKYSIDKMNILDGSSIWLRRVRSTEDMTSFEKSLVMTEHTHLTEELNTKLEQSGVLLQRKIERADSSVDITRFEKSSGFTEISKTTETEIEDAEVEQGKISRFSADQLQKASCTEDITSFEQITETTENSQTGDYVSLEKKGSPKQLLKNRDDEIWTTITTTETTTFTHEHENLQRDSEISIDHQYSVYDQVDRHSERNAAESISQNNSVLKSQSDSAISWTQSIENIDTIEFLKSSKLFDRDLKEMLSSESGIDHSQKFESMTDKDRNKIQMFIIYQDFAQMRERSRLRRQLALLSKQFERLDTVDSSETLLNSVQLTKMNSFLDDFLTNLKVTENLDNLRTQFEKVTSFKPVKYTRDDDNELHILMEKFSQILRELELHRDDYNLSAKLTYCLNFLKTKSLDGQFDSLCDFVCVESEREDMELLQNHLCLTKEGDFGCRRLMKYLGRGFSTDMKTIWRPKLRTCLQSVNEDLQLDFNAVSSLSHKDRDKPCCEFHGTDKGLLAELSLWSNHESVIDLSPTFHRKKGIIS